MQNLTSFDLIDIPMGTFWRFLGEEAPNQYVYQSIIAQHYKKNA